MALQLRDYQQDFVGDIHAAWRTVRSVLGVTPTGGGKTVCFASIIHDHIGAAAAVVHRREIVGQISLALGNLGVKHRIVAPPQTVTRIRRRHLRQLGKSFIDPNAQTGVVSVQTLTSKSSENDRQLQAWLAQVTLGVFDEGHHYVTKGLWAKAVERLHRAKLLFVTATPERADGLGLGVDADGFAETMVEGPDTQWLIQNGYLCPFRYFCPDSDLNTDGIPVTASGDLNTRAMRARVVESHLVGDVVDHYRKWADGKKAIVFANDVETAHEHVDAFRASGIRAEALSGKTEQGARDAVLDEFEGGDLPVLVNVDLFDEGFDVPGVEAVILARKTESLAKYLQMVGRALRVIYGKDFDLSTPDGRRAAIAASSKPFAAIIDPVRNWERHGMPNWPRRWSMDSRETRGRSGPRDVMAQKVCKGCGQAYEAYYLQCPYQFFPACANPPPPAGRSAPEQVDGDLQELDVEALAALFRKMEHADLNDGDFQQDMAARGVPSIGRAKQLRAHRASRHRRQVLRELVGWWMGLQPADRPLAEKHRRFYHRFGIDIGTAHTLKAVDTDALIERIQQRFTEDLAR